MTKSLPLTEPLDGPHKSVLDVIGNFSPKRKERKKSAYQVSISKRLPEVTISVIFRRRLAQLNGLFVLW